MEISEIILRDRRIISRSVLDILRMIVKACRMILSRRWSRIKLHCLICMCEQQTSL